jgi:SAM-dependent methyltransferase
MRVWSGRAPGRARRRIERALVERRYDLSPLASVADPAPAHEEHNAHAPTPWRLLPHILQPGDVGQTDVFVDFGCGTGRVMLEAAARYPLRRLAGVEIAPELAAAARALLSHNERYLRGRPWEVVTADVLDYEIPDDLTVAYLFDPFTGSVFDGVISRLEASVDRRPRRVRIVYVVPNELERLTRTGRVRTVRHGTAGWLRSGGRYEYFVGDLMPAV